MNFSVGLDWASQAHAVCVIDGTGRVRWKESVEHSAKGLAELLRQLARFGPPASLSVAIERPSGLVVDTLMDAGYRVVPIHPNALKASRPRYSAAGSAQEIRSRIPSRIDDRPPGHTSISPRTGHSSNISGGG